MTNTFSMAVIQQHRPPPPTPEQAAHAGAVVRGQVQGVVAGGREPAIVAALPLKETLASFSVPVPVSPFRR